MKKQSFWSRTLIYLLLLGGALLSTIPFLFMLSTSFKEHSYVFELPPRFIPENPTLSNYIQAWTWNNFELYFTNSFVVSLVTTLIVLIVASMLAFAFARFRFWGKNILYYLILSSLMVPSMMLIIPQFILAKNLRLLNSLPGLVFVYVAMNVAVSTFLLRGFFESLPRELEDATRMDGGGFFTIFFRIVLPLSKPSLATVTVFTFLFGWDEFVWALTAINQQSRLTLPVAIHSFHGAHQTQWGLVFAASMFAIAPVLIAFVLLQRHFIQGLTSGAIKG
ncbi:MAG: carbohydrate ABC transporter permease [Limnochordia bacterium]|mgnify:CR=1 FL=1|nr:carbohydrate ABC transporter permease [Limnochordia bacterium]